MDKVLKVLCVNFLITVNFINIFIQGQVEYCPWESFSATCESSEIIFMEQARYGRMRLGRCVKNDLGYVGCFTDVLDLADRWCSGRHSCEIPIPNAELDNLKPCLEDLKSYFEASYKCLKVDMYSPEKCQSGNKVELRSREGYIANVVTEESGCGSNIAPWRIIAAKGQTIEVHLTDFSVSHRNKNMEENSVDSHCPVYATIREEGVTLGQTICGGKGKERHLYTSIGNTVEIEIPLQTEERKKYYLLRYKISGCGDPKLSSSIYWAKRQWNEATVGCKSNENTWKLLCEDDRWIGKVGNCTPVSTAKEQVAVWSFPLSTGATVAVIIGISLAMGGIILVVGIVYLRKRGEEGSPTKSRQLDDMPYGLAIKAGIHDTRLEMNDNNTNTHRLSALDDKNDYMTSRGCPPTLLQDSSGQYGVHVHFAGSSRPPFWQHSETCKIYETTQPIGKIPPMSSTSEENDSSAEDCHSDPRYFELDPRAVLTEGGHIRTRPDIIGLRPCHDKSECVHHGHNH